jgi:hypothetical protein
MGRKRQYGTTAEKQRAYRERLKRETVIVDRRGLDRLHEQLYELQMAIGSASQRGESFAQECKATSVDTMLQRLTSGFNNWSGASSKPVKERRMPKKKTSE